MDLDVTTFCLSLRPWAGGKVEVTPDGGDIVIKVDQKDRQEIDTIIKLELDKPAPDIAPIKLPATGPTPAGTKGAGNL